MRTSEEATERIHQFIQSLPEGALFTGEELPETGLGSSETESLPLKLASNHEVVKMQENLYTSTKPSRFGTLHPRLDQSRSPPRSETRSSISAIRRQSTAWANKSTPSNRKWRNPRKPKTQTKRVTEKAQRHSFHHQTEIAHARGPDNNACHRIGQTARGAAPMLSTK